MKKRLWCALFVISFYAGISACSGKHTQPDVRQQVQGAQQNEDAQEMQGGEEEQRNVQGEQQNQAGAYQTKLPAGKEAAEILTKSVKETARKNWMLNPGFEKNDISMWKISYKGDTNPTDIRKKEGEAKSGEHSLHFGSEHKQNFKIEQTVSGLETGTYSALVNIQGGDIGSSAKIYLYARVKGKTIRSKLVKLSGWGKWKKPKIQGLVLDEKTDIIIGVKVKCEGGGWGTMDDFVLKKVDEKQNKK